MKKFFKYALISLLLIAINSLQAWAISDKIPRMEVYQLPSNAQLIAKGYGWDVFKEPTESYSACKLYLMRSATSEKNQCYLLLETKGGRQTGTSLLINARNKAAYNKNEYGSKDNANYEYGYIEAVDEVFVLDKNYILISGVPDGRNVYNYVLNLENYSAVHIEAYGDYVRTAASNKRYLEFFTSDYANNGRQEVKVWYDINGRYVKKLGPVRKSPSDKYRLVFYIWHAGDPNSHGRKSETGHAFAYVPQMGYIGYGGSVYDHIDDRPYATDSCVVFISGDQLANVHRKIREWQQFTPTYSIGTTDCTTFALDIADAAGVEYGERWLVHWPANLMYFLKQHNTSSSTKSQKNDWDEYNLKGAVRQMTIKSYTARYSNGQYVKDRLTDTQTITFSNEGKLQKEVWVEYKNGKQTITTNNYSYSANKRTKMTYENGTFDEKEVVVYTDWGGVASEVETDDEGDEWFRYEYTYDSRHRLMEERAYLHRKMIHKCVDYKYDKNDRYTSYTQYDENGQLEYVAYVEYDESGNLLSERDVKNGYTVRSLTSKYNQQGNVVYYSYKSKDYSDDTRYSQYKYDYNGNRVSYVVSSNSDGENKVEYVEYEYIYY